MALLLNEEQRLLRDSARDFFNTEAPISALRTLRDQRDPDGFSRQLWQRCGEMGFSGVLIDEAHGGSGLGVAEAAILSQCAGRTLAALPLRSSAMVGARLLAAAPNLADTWLPRIAAGQAVVTLALDEGAKHRPDRLATQARSTAEGWVLDGEKTLVPDGHVADLFIVAARSDQGVCLFAVPADANGLSVERTTMVDAHNAARVQLQGVALPATACIGGQSLLDATLALGRISVAAELLGLGEEIYVRTLTYLKERRQFGRLIGEFQALQHRAAELYCDLELAQAALQQAIEALDAEGDAAPDTAAATLIAVAKAKACQAADLAVREGVQMHGGIGMTDEMDMGLFMKRARVLQELYGDANFHEAALAQLHGY